MPTYPINSSLFDHHQVQRDRSPRHLLTQLGKTYGSMDEQSLANAIGENDEPAGFTFLGQFIDHDMKLDMVSQLDSIASPASIKKS